MGKPIYQLYPAGARRSSLSWKCLWNTCRCRGFISVAAYEFWKVGLYLLSYLGLNFVSRLQKRYALFSMKTGMMIVYDTARISKVHVSRHMVKHLLLENPFQKRAWLVPSRKGLLFADSGTGYPSGNESSSCVPGCFLASNKRPRPKHHERRGNSQTA